MSLPEVKRSITKISGQIGPEGLALTQALIKGFAGIGRGVDGAGCIAYLANLTISGSLHIETHNNSAFWVYCDAQGTRMVGGEPGDLVIPTIANIAVLFHNHAGYSEFDVHQVRDHLMAIPSKVMREIESRKDVNPVGQ